MPVWSQEAFLSALGLSLVHSLWQGAVIGILSLVLLPRLKSATADVRYSALCLLLMTIFVAWLGSLCCLYQAELRSLASLAPAGEAASIPDRLAAALLPAKSDAPMHLLRSLSTPLAMLWIAGVFLLSLRHLGGVLTLHRLRLTGATPCPPDWEKRVQALAARIGLRRRLCVLLSARVDVPLTFGIIKSYLLLPPSALMGLAPAQLEALIAHELAHIRRNDALFNFLQICVETALFYHPVVWRLSAQIRVAREQRCDDLAVQVVGDRALYARALYSMEELRASIPHLALGAKGDNTTMSNSHLMTRIRRVLGVHRPETRAPWMVGALVLCTATIGLATLWPVQAHSTPRAANEVKKPAAPAKKAKRTKVVNKIVKKTKIAIGINDKKYVLTTFDLTPDTHLKVNGKDTRFGDLSEAEQQEIRKAVDGARSAQGEQTPGIHTQTRIVMKTDAKTYELTSFDLTPETHLKVDGKETRFGDLSEAEQQQIRHGVEKARAAHIEEEKDGSE